MKINIISDIHAIYNPNTDRVFYNVQLLYDDSKYLKTVKELLKYWIEDSKKLKTINFSYSSIYDSYPDYIIVKNYEDTVKVLSDFIKIAECGFNGLTIDNAIKFSKAFINIRDIICKNNITWKNKKYKITLEAIRDWMYKKIYDFHPEKLEPADYLIIAGDLGLDNTYDKILADIIKRTEGKFKKILHIAGNHDHWWHGSQSAPNTARPDHTNFEHDYCEHQDGDYLFLGCTLWTPISDNSVWTVGRHMNDYNYTPGKFTPYVSRHQYEIQSAWLKNKLEVNKDKKVIVFTHHQPFEELILEDYKHNGKNWDGIDVNEAYVVTDHSLDDVNKYGNIKLWCCGHTHQNFDGILHDVHVVRNPIGYGDLYSKNPPENPSGTWYNKIIEV